MVRHLRGELQMVGEIGKEELMNLAK